MSMRLERFADDLVVPAARTVYIIAEAESTTMVISKAMRLMYGRTLVQTRLSFKRSGLLDDQPYCQEGCLPTGANWSGADPNGHAQAVRARGRLSRCWRTTQEVAA